MRAEQESSITGKYDSREDQERRQRGVRTEDRREEKGRMDRRAGHDSRTWESRIGEQHNMRARQYRRTGEETGEKTGEQGMRAGHESRT